MFEDARRFISTVLPWPGEGQTAYCNVHWRSQTSNDRIIWDGRAAATVDEAIQQIQWALKQTDIKDLYICMSLQSTCEDKVSKWGKSYRKAVRNAANALLLKSLFIDVDVKPDSYETTQEALAALKAFVAASNMPKATAIVASGSGGFHVHWVLDQPLPRDEWQVLAGALQKATVEFGLMCDSQCTIDSARILRVPDTFNNKTDTPKPVKLLGMGQICSLDEVRAALGKFIEVPVLKQLTPITENDELGAGIETKAKPMKLDDVARACAFIRNTVADGGANNAQPLWFLTASIASFMEDGREALHRMSKGHAGYDATVTDQLYDRVLAKRQDQNVGWPKCDKISGYGCKDCASCPLFQQKKSPLNFAIRAANDSLPAAPLPKSYFRGNDGLIYKSGLTETGEVISLNVCNYPFGEAWLCTTPEYSLHFITKTDFGQEMMFELPCELIFAKDGLGKFMGSKGFFVADNHIKLLREFLMSWVQHLQKSKDTIVSATSFGWTETNGRIDGFSFGGRVWMKDGDRPATNALPALAAIYKVKGTIEPWRELCGIINGQKRPALDALIAVGFAAPLMKFTGNQGAMLNAYSSESGVGKSTALRVGQAVWADPKRGANQLDDTENAVMLKVGHLRNLPLMWDEFQTEGQIQKFAKVAFNITGGREKNRLNANADLKTSGTWETMMASCANYSVLDHVAREMKSTTAGIYRCFEFAVPKTVSAHEEDGHVMRLSGQLNDNYGHAGLEYAQFLGANHERVRQDIAAITDSLWKEFKMDKEERFWNCAMACTLQGAAYANELGLTKFDLDQLKAFLVTVLGNMRESVKESPSDMSKDISMSAILGEYLNAMRARHTLITNRVWRFKGKPSGVKVVNDATKLDGIYVQIGREDGWVRFNSRHFSDWMADHGYSRTHFVKRMKDDFGMKDVVGNLCGGTDYVCYKDNLLEINLHDAKLKDFVE